MRLTKMEIAMLAMVLLAFILSLSVYPLMPERVASHWNARGEVDGTMAKGWGTFLMPVVLVGLVTLFMVIPRIDPLKANIRTFRKVYEGFAVFFLTFMLAIHMHGILWNLGTQFSPILVVSIGSGLLFLYSGVLLEQAKRNWFIGIRTPWTLSNDEVWDETHRLGGKLFKISGLLAMLGVIFQRYAVWFVLVPVLGTTLFSVIYSYIIYQKTEHTT